MVIINWDNINQNYLQIISSIYGTFVNIEDEKEKIRQIYLILFLRYYLNTEFIKDHIKAYYFLENIQYINIIDEVFNNIIHLNLSIYEINNIREQDEENEEQDEENEEQDEEQDREQDEENEEQYEEQDREQDTILIEYFINFFNEFFNINNLEDVKMVLNENDLNNISEKKYSEISTEFNTCSICLDELSKDNIIRQLNCNHIYHKECIDKYLLEYSYKCPICRTKCGNGIVKNS